MRMRRAARAVSEFYNGIMEHSGLHANQFTLLIPVCLSRGLPINQLAQFTGLDRTTLARNLKLLEERALITMRPGDDHRTRMVQITERGRQTLLEALPLWEQAQQQLGDYLGESQLTDLIGHLDKLETLLPPDRSEPAE
ncbi:MAG: MarR family winged helix-turn-helix transcriptional regulator [Aggregatilineales bacterium]